jgi:membrane protein DedA with SNARE-associated domain
MRDREDLGKMGIEVDTTGLVQFFEGYGYLALGALLLLAAGAPLPWPIAASFVVFGALTAHPSGPSLPVLALVATIAATAGHSLLYWLGRSSSPRLQRWRQRLERRFNGRATALRVEQGIARNAGLLIVITRCLLTPLAGPVSLLAGITRIALPRYLVWELAGTALYFCAYLALGRLLGPALLHDTGSLALFYGIVVVVIALPSLALWLRSGMLHRARPVVPANTAARESESSQ